MIRRPDATMVTHFSFLEDPRVDRTKLHPLINILVIALSAIICGTEGRTDVKLFGQSKRHWFAKSLDLSNGIPSHDTFGRVFAALDADQFQVCFASWVRALCERLAAKSWSQMARRFGGLTTEPLAGKQYTWSVLGRPRASWRWHRPR